MSHLRYALLLLMLGVLPTAVHAATLYVSPSGGGSACSKAAPCGSFDTAFGKMRAGDTLYLRGGTYNQAIRSVAETKIPSGTSYQNAITIAGYPGETARLIRGIDFSRGFGPHYVIVRDLTLDGTPQAQAEGRSGAFYAAKDSHHIRFDNVTATRETRGWKGEAFSGELDTLEVRNSRITGWEYGFYLRGTNHLLDHNEIYRNEGYGVHIYNSGASNVSGNVVSNNYVHDNGLTLAHGHLSAGILISHGTNNVAFNNVVENQGHALAGIQVGSQVTNNQVYNNTIIGSSGPCITTDEGAHGAIIRNNLCVGNKSQMADHGTGTVFAGNQCDTPAPGCASVGPASAAPSNIGAHPGAAPPPRPKPNKSATRGNKTR